LCLKNYKVHQWSQQTLCATEEVKAENSAITKLNHGQRSDSLLRIVYIKGNREKLIFAPGSVHCQYHGQA